MAKNTRTTTPKKKSVRKQQLAKSAPLPVKDERQAKLTELGKHITFLHGQSIFEMRTSLERAIEAGKSLLEARLLVRHGEWLPFLKKTGVPERTAQAYMQLARNSVTLSVGKSATVAGLQVRAALKQIAKSRNTYVVTRQARELEEKIADYTKENPRPPLCGKESSENHIYLKNVTDTKLIDERFAKVFPAEDTDELSPEEKAENEVREARIKAQDEAWKAGEPERAARRKLEAEAAEKRLTRAQDLIVAGYRVMGAKFHPDKPGGSKEDFQELEEIKKELLEYVEEQYEMLVPAVQS